jgi:DNA polymerase-1
MSNNLFETDYTETALFIHGNSLAYKAYYSLASIPPETGKKETVRSLFTNIIIRTLKEYKPTYCAATFDAPAPTKIQKPNLTLDTLYPALPTSLLKDIPVLKNILQAFNITVIQKKGYKASDIIGKLAHMSSEKVIETFIISGNKDVLQLVSPKIKIINPFQDYKIYEIQNIKSELGVKPEQIPDLLALIGEKDINLPGIEAIGRKGALNLLEEYGNIENLIKNIDKMKKSKRQQALKNNTNRLSLLKKIATTNTQIPLNISIEQCRLKPYNTERIKQIFKKLDMVKPLLKLIGPTESPHSDYKTITQKDELEELAEKMSNTAEISVDTETTSPSPTRADIVGLSISLKPGNAYYIPVAHRYLGAPKQLEWETVRKQLKSILENPKVKKIGQNIKYDYIVLKRAGIAMEGISFDTMLASQLLNPVRGEHNLTHLALKHLGLKMLPYKELVGDKKTIGEVEIEKVSNYACEDADFTFRIEEKLVPSLKKEEFEDVFYKLEMPLLPILGDMEINGIKVDRTYLLTLLKELNEEITGLSEEIFESVGERFNLNSPQQLSSILFEKLKLETKRKSKTGYYSTSASILEELKDKHPSISKIIEYRNLTKLADGFVDPLIKFINPKTGRIHTSYHQIGASTGRLASSSPNLQNIPIRGERGKDLRKAFIADKGNLLLSADYSQVELRIMAHFSKDELLTRAFQKENDIHKDTAIHLFNVPEDRITEDDRRKAKTVNFGIIYGISPFGLAKGMGIETDKAKEIIDNYFSTHPNVKKFIDSVLEYTRKKGYVRTLMGRKRKIFNINSDNNALRLQAEREAVNTPIQGTAAEVIKTAMINIQESFKENNLKTKMLLQIHDELLFEVPEKEADKVAKIVKDCMEEAVKLNIPLKVSIGKGENWLEAH